MKGGVMMDDIRVYHERVIKPETKTLTGFFLESKDGFGKPCIVFKGVVPETDSEWYDYYSATHRRCSRKDCNELFPMSAYELCPSCRIQKKMATIPPQVNWDKQCMLVCENEFYDSLKYIAKAVSGHFCGLVDKTKIMSVMIENRLFVHPCKKRMFEVSLQDLLDDFYEDVECVDIRVTSAERELEDKLNALMKVHVVWEVEENKIISLEEVADCVLERVEILKGWCDGKFKAEG